MNSTFRQRAGRLSRFLLVFAAPLVALTVAPPPQGMSAESYIAYVGTYTTKTQSEGIYAFRYEPAAGQLTLLGVAAKTADPSFLAVHPNGKYVYAVNEAGKSSMVSAFARNRDGTLTLLNQLSALGEDPCYISFDRTGEYALIANYTSGNVAVFPILPDGKLGEHIALVKDEGPLGPNKERQEGPHAHWIEPSAGNRSAYVADLGLDRILIYRFDATTGTLLPRERQGPPDPSGRFSVALEPGTGPRHAAFSRDNHLLYVLGELTSTVSVFASDARETYRQVQKISTLPPGFSGRNDAAEMAMHPSGKFLYTSNRGDDSIATFSVDPKTGKLTAAERVPSGGKEPRHFAIDPAGRFLLAENQWSDTIVVFRIDPSTGRLSRQSGEAAVPSPVCLVFASTGK